jgi:hypothetical protein
MITAQLAYHGPDLGDAHSTLVSSHLSLDAHSTLLTGGTAQRGSTYSHSAITQRCCRIWLYEIKTRRLRRCAHPPVAWSSPGRATGTTTLRAALAGRARSRPGHPASVPGRCAATADAANERATRNAPRTQPTSAASRVSVPSQSPGSSCGAPTASRAPMASLSSRNEISYPLGGIVRFATCDDANFSGFVVPFRLLTRWRKRHP